MESLEYYYKEWISAQLSGDDQWAELRKEEYKLAVLETLKQEYKEYFMELGEYPPIYLN
jgi:hypothetical protein